MAALNRRMLEKILELARRRARWVLRPPTVRGAIPRMYPGAMRLGNEEEEAAVEAVRAVVRSKKLFRYVGPSPNPFQQSRVRDFERAFAARAGTKQALAVNSGTSALVCALVGLGIGPGDEVIVPAFTWVSTASAVVAVGAVPIIAEVDDSLTLDPADVARRITPYTRAMIAVHMRGAPARLDALIDLARRNGIFVVEDVAQALGGEFRGRMLGSIGDAGAYSFQLSKTLTAGEGGLLVTADAKTHRRAFMYHDSAVCMHAGVTGDEWLAGVNLRMSEVHAAILAVQLTRLDGLLADMRARKARVKGAIRAPLERRGVKMRTIHDDAGDAATALVFFLPDAARVQAVVKALGDENVPASRLYQDLAYLPHDHVDLHVYTSWAPILEKRAWSPSGEPWRRHPREISYPADMCPATLDLLRRAVHVDVSPDLSPEQAEQMGAAIAAIVERML
jgi:8-amino-3,8-dideoxy-alpha-D-manno-octulosonate transaminase